MPLPPRVAVARDNMNMQAATHGLMDMQATARSVSFVFCSYARSRRNWKDMDSRFGDDIELIGSSKKCVSFSAESDIITIRGLDEFEEEDSASLSDTVKTKKT